MGLAHRLCGVGDASWDPHQPAAVDPALLAFEGDLPPGALTALHGDLVADFDTEDHRMSVHAVREVNPVLVHRTLPKRHSCQRRSLLTAPFSGMILLMRQISASKIGAACWAWLLVLGVVPGTMGCRKEGASRRASGNGSGTRGPQKSRGRSHGERIVLFRGFDRKEVPNLTLHVLEASTLKVLRRVELALDNHVVLSQIGRCRFFEAIAPNSKPRVLHLTADFQLLRVSADDVPARCWSAVSRVKIDLSRPRASLKIQVGATKLKLPLPAPPDGRPEITSRPSAVVLNQGRSAVVLDGYGRVFAVSNLRKPRLQKLGVEKAYIVASYHDLLAADVQSRVAFLALNEMRTILYRLDPLGGRHVRLADLGKKAPAKLLHLARERLLLYKSRDENTVLVLDDRTGQILRRMEQFPDRHIVRLKDKAYAIAGREVIDVGSGRVVVTNPVLAPPSVLSADQKHLYGMVWVPGLPSTLTIQRYDFTKWGVSHWRTLEDVGHGKVHTYTTMNYLFLVPDGLLLAVGGDATHFLNHAHK